jgi:hypothetical protein
MIGTLMCSLNFIALQLARAIHRAGRICEAKPDIDQSQKTYCLFFK